MKSVLMTTDFVEDDSGKLWPVEINTNSSWEFDYQQSTVDNNNFEEIFNGFFDYEGLHTFMQTNSLSKIHVIDTPNESFSVLFKLFCQFYNYECEVTINAAGAETIPDIEEEETTLLIRVAYDSYSILDDVYARDNYEFFNLIQSESFCLPTYFNTQNGVLDTITELEVYSDDRFPNYMVKSRFPNYLKNEYPSLYKISNWEEFEELKSGVNDDGFIQKYCTNSSSLSENEDRIGWYRSGDLIISSTFEVLNLFSYEKRNSISISNEKLVYDSYFVSESKELSLLPRSTFLPYSKAFYDSAYHFDKLDYVLTPFNNLINFENIEIETELKTIQFDDEMPDKDIDISELNNFEISSSTVQYLKETENFGVFVNVTAYSSESGEFSWYDGADTPYFLRKSGSSQITFDYQGIGTIEEGDEIYVYHNSENKLVPFQITNVFFDVKNIVTYKLTLSDSPLFFVEIDNEENEHTNSPWFLIQHNACNRLCAPGTGFPYTCGNIRCNDCGKGGTCINCGGIVVSNDCAA